MKLLARLGWVLETIENTKAKTKLKNNTNYNCISSKTSNDMICSYFMHTRTFWCGAMECRLHTHLPNDWLHTPVKKNYQTHLPESWFHQGLALIPFNLWYVYVLPHEKCHSKILAPHPTFLQCALRVHIAHPDKSYCKLYSLPNTCFCHWLALTFHFEATLATCSTRYSQVLWKPLAAAFLLFIFWNTTKLTKPIQNTILNNNQMPSEEEEIETISSSYVT